MILSEFIKNYQKIIWKQNTATLYCDILCRSFVVNRSLGKLFSFISLCWCDFVFLILKLHLSSTFNEN